MRRWLATLAAVGLGAWLALTAHYFTVDLLSCFPWARLWR